MEQEQYEDDVKVVILPDRQEVTQEDLATMPDVVRERVRHESLLLDQNKFYSSMALPYKERQTVIIMYSIPNESPGRYVNTKSWIIMCVTLKLSCLSNFICLPSDLLSPKGIPVNRGYHGC